MINSDVVLNELSIYHTFLKAENDIITSLRNIKVSEKNYNDHYLSTVAKRELSKDLVLFYHFSNLYRHEKYIVVKLTKACMSNHIGVNN